MASCTSSSAEAIARQLALGKGSKRGHNDGAYAAFTKPGFAYARLPLDASLKQIRKANHLMPQQGHCYLRVFVVEYCRQSAALLGQNPMFSQVKQQLGIHPIFHRGNILVTAYISAPFQAHFAISRKENPFHLGILRRHNNGLPIGVGADKSLLTPAWITHPPPPLATS